MGSYTVICWRLLHLGVWSCLARYICLKKYGMSLCGCGYILRRGLVFSEKNSDFTTGYILFLNVFFLCVSLLKFYLNFYVLSIQLIIKHLYFIPCQCLANIAILDLLGREYQSLFCVFCTQISEFWQQSLAKYNQSNHLTYKSNNKDPTISNT